MLRFLYEFAEPVDDRVVGQTSGEGPWSWEYVGFSQQSSG